MKAIYWAGSSKEDLKGFPLDAKKEVGFQLGRVQNGLNPNDWKPMKTVGTGVREIRIEVEPEGQFRVIYVARLADRIVVLHAFHKKTQKTRKSDIDLAKTRLSAALKEIEDERKNSDKR